MIHAHARTLTVPYPHVAGGELNDLICPLGDRRSPLGRHLLLLLGECCPSLRSSSLRSSSFSRGRADPPYRLRLRHRSEDCALLHLNPPPQHALAHRNQLERACAHGRMDAVAPRGGVSWWAATEVCVCSPTDTATMRSLTSVQPPCECRGSPVHIGDSHPRWCDRLLSQAPPFPHNTHSS